MRRVCVIGWPVSHSLSPALHSYWLKQYSIDGSYEAWEVPPENLVGAMQQLREKKFIGCNLTLPHKELVLPMLGNMDAEVRQIGAANTIVVNNDGSLHGKNTDAYGFMENLRASTPFNKGKAVVLGAGGAAKAVVKALLDEGFVEVMVANRTKEKAEKLARQFAGECVAGGWEWREQMLEGADLLVNATSLGLKGKEPLHISLASLPETAVVVDIVYSPLETDLLKAAKAKGNTTVDGLGMLMHQAVPAFEAWFGFKPEVTRELRAHLEGKLV